MMLKSKKLIKALGKSVEKEKLLEVLCGSMAVKWKIRYGGAVGRVVVDMSGDYQGGDRGVNNQLLLD